MIDPGVFFRFVTVVTLVGGTLFLMWLGEQITARGVGNGISLIIFAGIVAELPNYIVQTSRPALSRPAPTSLSVGCSIIGLAVRDGAGGGRRRVHRSARSAACVIQYPKRQQSATAWYGGESSLPAAQGQRSSGVIPAIFASSLLMLPNTLAGFNAPATAADGSIDPNAVAQTGLWGDVLTFIQAYLGHGPAALHRLSFVGADHLLLLLLHLRRPSTRERPPTISRSKTAASFPGMRPGKSTAEYLDLRGSPA